MKKTGFDTEEERFEQSVDEQQDDFFETDSIKVWLREISKYPLLTAEEEKECGHSLKQKEGLEIVDEKKQLEMGVLLANLKDNPYSKEIIRILKELFEDLGENSLDEYSQLISKYERFCEKNKRVPTKEEFERVFNLHISNKTINPEDLYNQVKRFSKYMEAKYKMFHSNLRLVVRPAKQCSYKTSMEFMDLAIEGSVGLMKAVERFNVDLGYKFSTYAIWWIRQSILRYVNDNATSFKMNKNEYKEIKEFKDSVEQLENMTKRKYTAEELSKIFDMPYQEVVAKIYYNSTIISLDSIVGEEEDTSLESIIPGKEVDFEENIFKSELRKMLDECFSYLKPQEELIMRLFTGLNDENKPYDVYEIAKKTKKTKKVVTLILDRAIKKMRMLVQRNEEVKQFIHYMK